jgi:hypothetical protein
MPSYHPHPTMKKTINDKEVPTTLAIRMKKPQRVIDIILHYDLVMYHQHAELLQLLYYFYAKGKFIMNKKFCLVILLKYQLKTELKCLFSNDYICTCSKQYMMIITMEH